MTTLDSLVRATVGGSATDDSSLPPQPVIPIDPVENGLPSRSESKIFSGSLLDYLPVPCTCESQSCKPEMSGVKRPVVGLMDPQGIQHSSGTFHALWNQLLFTLMLDPSTSTASGSVIQETDYWQLIAQDIVPANTTHQIQVAITNGVSQTDTTSFAYTVGIKIGGSYQGITGELSASLTKSFTHAVTVSEQQTVTRTFTVDAAPYQQVVGIYQLMQAFAVIPGANLTQYMLAWNKNFGPGSAMCVATGTCMNVAAGGGVANPTPTYLQIVAHDQTGAAAARPPILSMSDALALAKSSVTVATP